MGRFLPREVMDMVVRALRLGSGSDSDEDEGFVRACWSGRGAGRYG